MFPYIFTFLLCLSLATSNRTPKIRCHDLEMVISRAGLPSNIHFNATAVAAGALQIGHVSGNNVSLCRVIGSIEYGSKGNDTLNFELWLPEISKYNRRYLSIGNGGFAGTIDYGVMLQNLNAGYAVGGCDSGHPSTDNGQSKPGSYVPYLNDHDETLAWIHNSIAMFTEPSKKLTTVYYGNAPKKMYYSGCSTGGAQGFALAQFHPDVFDGIYAGSPGNYYSHLILSFLWNGLNSNKSDAFLDQDALELITTAVLEKCDTIDGVRDGILEDPTKCHFDVSSLQCSAYQTPLEGNKTVCLTASQIENVKKFYSGPKDPRNGKQVYPPFALGSERQWMQQEKSLYLQYGVPILQNLVFKNLSYDYTKFNWGTDVDTVDRIASPLIDGISPNLQAFKNRGGKMIVTQGWADPFNSPFWPIQQRDEMFRVFGKSLSSFYSLFMIPGGGHCGGASGYPQVPGTYHVLDRLVPWVEQGKIPQDLIATGPADGSRSTMTLRPYV